MTKQKTLYEEDDDTQDDSIEGKLFYHHHRRKNEIDDNELGGYEYAPIRLRSDRDFNERTKSDLLD